MKAYRKIHKQIFHFTIALIFIIGLSCPTSITLGQEKTDNDVDHSGGFTVKIDKIEGVMNAFEIMQGNIDIPEGQMFGLTITKKITETKYGTLVINIKSPGPIPIDNLTAKSIGYPFFESLCDASKEDWLCMQGVEMTLSQQSVNSINLPNATVESCYEGQCADDKPANEELMSLMSDESKSIEDIEHDLQSATQILQVAEEQLTHASELHDTIIEEEQEAQVSASLESFHVDEADGTELVQNAENIHTTYETFNENVSQFALTTSVIDDVLKQVMLVLERDSEELENIEETLNEANETYISESKQNEKSNESTTENEELEKTIENLKTMIAKLEEQTKKLQSTLQPLETSSTTLLETLKQFFETIQKQSDDLADVKDENDVQKIREWLNVSEPAKGLEKQLNDVLAQYDDVELVDQTTKQKKLIGEANEQAQSTVLSVPLAKQIGELDARIEEEIQEESNKWENNSKQIKTLEMKLETTATLAQLPEALALEHKLDVILEDKHEYRVSMFDKISHWKQLMSTLKEKQDQLEDAVEQHQSNKQLLAQLTKAIIKFKQRYTDAELSTIAKYLNIAAFLEREQKISEVVKNGSQVVKTVEPLIEEANHQLGRLESLSDELVNKVIGINLLQDESYDEFKVVFEQFKKSIAQLETPMIQLNNHLMIAEELLGNEISEYAEIQPLYTAVDNVSKMANRVDKLIHDLDSLPYFEKIKDVVKDMKKLKSSMNKMLE